MKKNIFIRKEVFDWMIDESQYPIDFVEQKFAFIDSVRNGDGITFRQAKTLANFLKIPFGFLFLDEPPKNGELYADFRTIGNKQNNKMSKDLKDVLLDMDYKKNWLSSYRKSNDAEENEYLRSITLEDNVLTNANKLRQLLDLNIDWFRRTSTSSLQFLKSRIENKGFVVMSSGIVGQNTKRKLDINEFRGFALFDLYAPLIFINSADNESAECFTLVHELVHLLSSKDDDIISQDNNIESKINRIVAEFLMPSQLIIDQTKNRILDNDFVHRLATYFRVNDFAMAFRLYSFGLIDLATLNFFSNKAKKNSTQKRNGGNYYATIRNRLSISFAGAVIDCVNSRNLTFVEGVRLLGISGKAYKNFETMMERSR